MATIITSTEAREGQPLAIIESTEICFANCEAELAALSPEDKALVASLAGEDPAAQLKAIEALRTAGKIGAANGGGGGVPIPQSRIASQEPATQEPPKDWREASMRTAEQIREASKKTEA